MESRSDSPVREVTVAERIFRMFSLAFLSIGFVVAVAGADRNGPHDLANATSDLIQHVSAAKDANTLNAAAPIQSNKGISLTADTNTVARATNVDDSNVSKKTKDSNPRPLPPQAN